MRRLMTFTLLLVMICGAVTLPLSPADSGTVHFAYAQISTPSVSIEGILSGSVPGRYNVVTADIVFDNNTSRELRVNTTDIVITDWDGREYPAEIYSAGYWYGGYDPWGRPYYYPYPQYTSVVFVLPNSRASIRVSFYLPLDKDPRTIIIRHQGQELRRATVF